MNHARNRKFLTILPAMIGLLLATPASATVLIFEDDFDSDTIGSTPAGWTATSSTNNFAHISGTNSGVGGSKSLNIYSQITSDDVNAFKSIGPITSLSAGESVIYAVDFLMQDSASGEANELNIYMDTQRSLQFRDATGSGTISVNNTAGASLGGNSLAYDTWYRVEMEFPGFGSGETVDVTITDVLTSASVGTYSYVTSVSLTQFDQIAFRSGVNANKVDAFVNNISVSVVPEPSSAALLLVGAGAFALLIRRRRK